MRMRRLTWTVLAAAALLPGCGSDETKSEKTSGTKPAATKTADPAPKPAESPAPPPDDQPKAIVIKGSKKKTDDEPTKQDDPEQQARIEDLKRRAAASQGQDNGTPVKAPDVPKPKPSNAPDRKAALKSDIEGLKTRITALEDEKKSLLGDPHKVGKHMTQTSSDPDRTAQIDLQLKDLYDAKSKDELELADLEGK
jgi:hypothetical protein